MADVNRKENELIEWNLLNQPLSVAVTFWQIIITKKIQNKVKTYKYKYFKELMFQIFEEKHTDFPLWYSYWQKLLKFYSELIGKFTEFN